MGQSDVKENFYLKQKGDVCSYYPINMNHYYRIVFCCEAAAFIVSKVT